MPVCDIMKWQTTAETEGMEKFEAQKIQVICDGYKENK